MQFTDAGFLALFLPCALILHRFAVALSPGRYGMPARLCIFLLTLVFYGYRHEGWLIPFAICICFDFVWATLLTRARSPGVRKLLLAASVSQNLSLLAFYKYWKFLAGNLASISPEIATVMRTIGAHASTTLPAGISFYTFESLSFVIDVYLGRIAPPKRPDEFFAFIGMFPRFVAGPIVRYRDLCQQFVQYRGMQIRAGLVIFAVGLFYKCCFADNFALYVPLAFNAKHPDCLTAWLSTIAYAMQIYFDFYGYSLMATGLGVCLGFRFPNNFNRPYLAADLRDFWRRWHISLSSWLRDYLYIPLGGSQNGRTRTYVNLFLTMLIGGLWHGANWTFVIWGALHGFWLCIERLVSDRVPPYPKRAVAMLIVLVAWVFFRADDLGSARTVLGAMFSPFAASPRFDPTPFFSALVPLLCCLTGIFYCLFGESRFDPSVIESLELPGPWQLSAASILFSLSVPIGSPNLPRVPFLYFQF